MQQNSDRLLASGIPAHITLLPIGLDSHSNGDDGVVSKVNITLEGGAIPDCILEIAMMKGDVLSTGLDVDDLRLALTKEALGTDGEAGPVKLDRSFVTADHVGIGVSLAIDEMQMTVGPPG